MNSRNKRTTHKHQTETVSNATTF